MRKRRILAWAYECVKQRGLRTTLTILGVIIGISLIITIVSLSHGFRGTVRKHIEKTFTLDVLAVRPAGKTLTGEGKAFFTENDTEKIRQIPQIRLATPIRQYMVITLYKDDRNTTAYAIAVNYTEFAVVYPNRMILDEGELPQSSSNDSILLGYNVAHQTENQTFASYNDNVTAEWRWIRNIYSYRVAGILEETGITETINLDDCVIVSLKMAEEVYRTSLYQLILVKIDDPYQSESVATEIENLFKDQVRVTVPITYLEQSETILTILEVFLTAIASISLFVAGMGIMNTMTVSVIERTREIGILKALGAKNRTILAMFLTEALLIGLIGGTTGIPLGYGLAIIIGYTIPNLIPPPTSYPGTIQKLLGSPETFRITPQFVPTWTAAAFTFSLTLSLLFGWYPAKKAAKLDPVVALRYE